MHVFYDCSKFHNLNKMLRERVPPGRYTHAHVTKQRNWIRKTNFEITVNLSYLVTNISSVYVKSCIILP